MDPSVGTAVLYRTTTAVVRRSTCGVPYGLTAVRYLKVPVQLYLAYERYRRLMNLLVLQSTKFSTLQVLEYPAAPSTHAVQAQRPAPRRSTTAVLCTLPAVRSHNSARIFSPVASHSARQVFRELRGQGWAVGSTGRHAGRGPYLNSLPKICVRFRGELSAVRVHRIRTR